MSKDRMDRFIWEEGDVQLRFDRAVIDFDGFADAELIESFRKATAEQGTSMQEVLSDFIKDYVVSSGHPELVNNRWPWNNRG